MRMARCVRALFAALLLLSVVVVSHDAGAVRAMATRVVTPPQATLAETGGSELDKCNGCATVLRMLRDEDNQRVDAMLANMAHVKTMHMNGEALDTSWVKDAELLRSIFRAATVHREFVDDMRCVVASTHSAVSAWKETWTFNDENRTRISSFETAFFYFSPACKLERLDQIVDLATQHVISNHLERVLVQLAADEQHVVDEHDERRRREMREQREQWESEAAAAAAAGNDNSDAAAARPTPAPRRAGSGTRGQRGGRREL